MSVLFTYRCQYYEILSDCHTSERFTAIKTGLIHHFLHKKMPVPSQQYDSCCLFVWCSLIFCFCRLIRDFPFWILIGVQYFWDFTFHGYNQKLSKLHKLQKLRVSYVELLFIVLVITSKNSVIVYTLISNLNEERRTGSWMLQMKISLVICHTDYTVKQVMATLIKLLVFTTSIYKS